MEGGLGVGTSTLSSHSTRPVRSSSRFYYNTTTAGNNGSHGHASSPVTFSGPVRRWQKKWVHVSSSPSSLKHRKQSNRPNTDKSSILLCKWTPLSSTGAVDELPRRKFRYTPIGMFEDEKKLTAKRVVDDNEAEERLATDSDDIYGMLDNDQVGEHQEGSKCTLAQYSRRSNLSLGLCMENQNKDGQVNMMNLNGY